MTLLRRALSLLVLVATLSVAAQARMQAAGSGPLGWSVFACHATERAGAPLEPRAPRDCVHCLVCGTDSASVGAEFDPQSARVAFRFRAPFSRADAARRVDIAEAHRARAPPRFA
jgi:hypothetical protein